jgi:hypothetical protein
MLSRYLDRGSGRAVVVGVVAVVVAVQIDW